MARVKRVLVEIGKRILSSKRQIARHVIIYLIILLAFFPFIFLYRTDIYTTLLSRHDEYREFTNDRGIPVTEYGYQAGVYVGEKITPRAVANAAIAYYGAIQEGNTSAIQFFNNCISWLTDHYSTIGAATENGTIQVNHWCFDFAIWDLPPGWYQSMTDAKALHALALAYEISPNATYLEIASGTVRSFEIPIEYGGNLYVLEDGTHWYPEYIVPASIDPNYEPYLVLNGFLIALHHLYLANRVFRMQELADVFNKGVVSAAGNLHMYDMEDVHWTRYHLAYPVKIAPSNYHKIHVDLCKKLYEYTNVSVFHYYYERWAEWREYPSLTIYELTSPEFLYFGVVVAVLILTPVFILDLTYTIFKHLRDSRRS